MNGTTTMTQVFKALADENRLKIVQLLSQGTLCACKILESFAFSQPALSQHMKVLITAGVVTGARQGNWMHYSLNEETMEGLKVFVTEIQSAVGDSGQDAGGCAPDACGGTLAPDDCGIAPDDRGIAPSAGQSSLKMECGADV
ncbi:MAG: metalloregulator ArsR/SmtB family transcription factor [Clostridia bacterium]